MTNIQLQIIIIACLTAGACSIPGVFLVLRKMTMISDAISHSILFGIVLAFFAVKKIDSPFIVLAAAATGMLTVVLVEMLLKTSLVKEDAAIGMVYPLLFSIAVVLISLYAGNIHLDTDMVLMGELAFSPFNTLIINGKDLGPVAIYQIGGVLLINIIFAVFFYKELKLTIFDPNYAQSLGFSPKKLMYGLMLIVAITIVAAFEVAGSIMVVGFIVAPAVIASYFTKRLWVLILIAPVVGAAASVSGYQAAHLFDVSIAGSIVTILGIMFFISLVIAPKRGILSKMINSNKIKTDLSINMLLVHLLQHESDTDKTLWSDEDATAYMFNWNIDYLRSIIQKCLDNKYIKIQNNILTLEDEGRRKAISAIEN